MRKLILLALLLTLSAATVTSPTTVSGDGAVHSIAASGFAKVIIISAWPSNSTATCGTSAISGCPWVGDSNVSTSRGQFLVPGASLTLPESHGLNGSQSLYPLAGVFYLVQSGDKISITLVQ